MPEAVRRALLFITLLGFLFAGAPIRAADRSAPPIISRIPREAVVSRALASVGYSKRLRMLEIELQRGGTYRYLDLPVLVYRQLLGAESKARFYNLNVRGRYRALRVKTPRES